MEWRDKGMKGRENKNDNSIMKQKERKKERKFKIFVDGMKRLLDKNERIEKIILLEKERKKVT